MKTKRKNPGPHRNDLAAIKQLAARWRAGWQRGDADALVSLYADRPALLPQGRPAIRRRTTIHALYRGVLAAVKIKSRSRVEAVRVSGELGYFWSTYSLQALPKGGGQPIRSRGKSLFIVQRQRDGTWKIALLMDNSDE